jgi:BioD-like phosphotransacetylase family protein
MKAVYITSVEPFIGKTAVCVALGKRLQADGHAVGYLKPISTQPWRTPDGQVADEDASFVCSALGLTTNCTELTPVMITPAWLRERLQVESAEDLLQKIRAAARVAADGKDVLIVEGGGSMREGYAVGLSNLRLAEELGAPVVVLVRYHRELQVVDDALAAHFRLGKQLLGVIINHVPTESMAFVTDHARAFLEHKGIHTLGVIPSVPRLSALSVGELIRRLEAQVLTPEPDLESLIENFTVGAMTLDAALSHFRRQPHKAVITGGDRTDIQLAALETSTKALILTGNLVPSPDVVRQAEAVGVPILLVKENTIETVSRIEQAYGKTRLGESEKLATFMELMEKHVDIAWLYTLLGLT